MPGGKRMPLANNPMNNLPKKYRHGLVFGKFMPLHEGHLHLLRFASASCERLTILVCSLPTEPIPGEIRYQWVKASFPEATVVHHSKIVPQYPEEHPEFWQIWKNTILDHAPQKDFDTLFTSEDYGWRMAKELAITHIPVDRVRTLVPISGTEIRANPLKHWEHLPAITRPYFLKRIRIVGPESSGKSTLTQALAKQFKTSFVDEYARRLLDEYARASGRGAGAASPVEIETIARGQLATEEALAFRANRVLFLDTDLKTTQFWSHFYFKSCPVWIEEEAKSRKYDLTLLLTPELPWVADPQRAMESLEERRTYFNWWKQELEQDQAPYVIISGTDGEARTNAAQQAVLALGIDLPL